MLIQDPSIFFQCQKKLLQLKILFVKSHVENLSNPYKVFGDLFGNQQKIPSVQLLPDKRALQRKSKKFKNFCEFRIFHSFSSIKNNSSRLIFCFQKAVAINFKDTNLEIFFKNVRSFYPFGNHQKAFTAKLMNHKRLCNKKQRKNKCKPCI